MKAPLYLLAIVAAAYAYVLLVATVLTDNGMEACEQRHSAATCFQQLNR